MKSFEQLAKAAYNAWHDSIADDPKHRVAFETRPAPYRAAWIAVAKAIAQEIAAVH
jgi:hypothetical protein